MKLILIFFALYLVTVVALNLLALSYRRKLVASVVKAKCIEGVTSAQAGFLDGYVLSMTSMRTAVILFLIFWQLALMPKPKLLTGPELSADDMRLWDSGLMPEILDMHMASAAAVNPIFGSLAYAMRAVVDFRFRRLLGDEGEWREAYSVNSRYAAC